MLKLLIAVIIFIIVFLIIRSIRIKILLTRIENDFDVLNSAYEVLFGSEKFKGYEDKQVKLEIGNYILTFQNFTYAAIFIEEYCKGILYDCQEITSMTNKYKFSKEEQYVEDIMQKIRIWKWKNGSSES